MKIILAAGVVGAVGIVGLVCAAIGWSPESSGKHLAHVDWLPPEASDVTYAKRDGLGWFTCYECNLPKEAFDRFAQANRWKPEHETDVSLGGFRRVLGLPPLKDSGLDSVSKALRYERRQPNGGGITAVYDLEAGRLFVYESHR